MHSIKLKFGITLAILTLLGLLAYLTADGTADTQLLVTSLTIIVAVWGAFMLFDLVRRNSKKLTLAREQSDDQLRLLLDSTIEAIFGMDTEGRCTFCNPVTVKLLGYQNETQLLGQDIHKLIRPIQADGSPYAESERLIFAIISSGDGIQCDNEVFWRSDGTSFPVSYRGHPVVHQDGKVVGAIVTFLDISDKLHAKQLAHKFSQVIEQASDAILITHKDSVIEYLNPAFERLTGHTRADLVGTKTNITSRAYQDNQLNREMTAKLDKGESYAGIRLHTRKDGKKFYARETVTPLKNESGDTSHFVCMLNDISMQMEHETNIQSIMTQKQNAEHANLEKSSFLANMSHELRTPLNAIIGYSEMLEEDLLNTTGEEYIEDVTRIKTAGNHLLALIDDILDFSNIQAGKLEFYSEELQLKSLLDEVIGIAKPMMRKGDNQFIHNIADPGAMVTDVLRLRQCLLNLLSNAAKFTERGIVTLSVHKHKKLGQERIFFIVSDTGMGIAAEKIPKLFDEFAQTESSEARRDNSTGLGLAISRRLVRAMGGDISVESELGKGTNFTINMPVAADDKDKPQQAATG